MLKADGCITFAKVITTTHSTTPVTNRNNEQDSITKQSDGNTLKLCLETTRIHPKTSKFAIFGITGGDSMALAFLCLMVASIEQAG